MHDYKVGAEIGVGGGVFSEMICQRNPGVKLFCVDAWEVYEGYDDFLIPEYLEDDYKRAILRLAPYKVNIIRKYSMDAVQDFADGSLDFVYIDGNHKSPYIVDDIREWSPKVRSGGIVSGHDYVDIHQDVIVAVNDYVNGHHCRPLFLVGNLNEHGDAEMSLCSWFWVQP